MSYKIHFNTTDHSNH